MLLDVVEVLLHVPAIGKIVIVGIDDKEVFTGEERRICSYVPKNLIDINTDLRFAVGNFPSDDGIVGLLPDLPAVRTDEILHVLELAEKYETSFISDFRQTGTTMFMARSRASFMPAFGNNSADRHLKNGAVKLDVPSDAWVSRDCDSLTELLEIPLHLLGPATRLLLEQDMHG